MDMFPTMHRRSLFLLTLFACPIPAATGIYAGVLGGVSTLSADAGSQATTQGLSLSAYSPENGGALNVFGGVSLHDYFSLQANYIRNRNDLLLSSTSSAADTFMSRREPPLKTRLFWTSWSISGDEPAGSAPISGRAEVLCTSPAAARS
jgi:hypothetical protein